MAAGEVALIVVAGGSGTRLGFDGPKGTFPIGPVSSASLFQIHAEKIVALGRRHGRPLPLYVMTSPENHAATIAFFEANHRFEIEHVRFFTQGRMPAVNRDAGKVLLAAKDRVALSPDGHGGTLAALAAPGPDGSPSCLQEMRQRGIQTLFYFQVDNPLVQIADPAFLGLHRQADAEMSFKVIERLSPDEKLGVVVLVDGRPEVIEYSDLPPELASLREPDGRLSLWAGSIAIHVLELPFIERIVGGHHLPFHRAIKKVPYVDETGRLINPAEPNGVKFEQFIFDALPQARRWAIVETDRGSEFEPLKNAVGQDSPATVHQRMSDLFGNWLEQAGATIPAAPTARFRSPSRSARCSPSTLRSSSPGLSPGSSSSGRSICANVMAPERSTGNCHVGERFNTRKAHAVRDHHGGRKRHAVLAQEPSRSTQAAPEALRLGDDAAANCCQN